MSHLTDNKDMSSDSADTISTSFPIRAAYVLFYFSLAVLFVLMYRESISNILGGWHTLGASHFPLIIAVSLYLIWIRRHEIRKLNAEPALMPGGLLLGAGCFMLFAGKIGGTIVVQQISMVPVLLGGILLLGGFSYFKIFLLPVGYLVFLTGFIDMLLGNFAIYFQQITAWLSANSFRLIGFPVFHENIIIMLPHISLEVVRGCSGINQIVALLALAIPLAYMTQKTMARKIILVLSAPIIAIIVNGMRVSMIGIYALYDEGADLHGPYETFAATVIFYFGFMFMILFSLALNKIGSKDNDKNYPASAQDSFKSTGTGNYRFSSKKLYSQVIVGLIPALTLGLVHFHHPQYVELSQPLTMIPDQVAGFTAAELETTHDRIRPFPADEELIRIYKDDQGNEVEIYVGYFGLQDRERKIIDYRRSWMHESVSRFHISGKNSNYVINKTHLRDQSRNSYIYFWYQMDDRIIRNEYAGKILTFINSFFRKRNNASVVVMKTNCSENEIKSFMTKVVPEIKDHLSG